jgi:hypothetical protein
MYYRITIFLTLLFLTVSLSIPLRSANAEPEKFIDVREKVTKTKGRFRKYLSYSEFLNESIERLNRDFIDEMKTIEKLSEKEEVLKAKYRAMKIDDDFVSHLELLSKKYGEFYSEVEKSLNEILNLNIKFNNQQEGDFFSRLVRSIEEDHEKILVYYSNFKEKEKFINESADGLKKIFRALVVERGALVYKEPGTDRKEVINTNVKVKEDIRPDLSKSSEKRITENKSENKPLVHIRKQLPENRPEKNIKKKKEKKKAAPSVKKKPKEKIVFEKLEELSFSDPKFTRPMCIMIENHRAARPQSGLELADIVFEMLAEGGITRFMAVLAPEVKGVFGPVRSCRHYFTDFVSQFDGIYAHCGSSTQGLEAMKARKIKSINEIKYGKPFYRVKFRKSPHNLYCRSENVLVGAKKYGLRMKTDIAPPAQQFLRNETPVSKGSKTLVQIKYHKRYSVSYLYNKSENRYFRTVNTKPHIVYGTKQQLSTSNLIVMRADTKVIDSYGRLDIDFSGSGDATAYFGGEMVSGKWVKESPRDIIKFYDSSNNEIRFNPGNIWIQVVRQNTVYSPK